MSVLGLLSGLLLWVVLGVVLVLMVLMVSVRLPAPPVPWNRLDPEDGVSDSGATRLSRGTFVSSLGIGLGLGLGLGLGFKDWDSWGATCGKTSSTPRVVPALVLYSGWRRDFKGRVTKSESVPPPPLPPGDAGAGWKPSSEPTMLRLPEVAVDVRVKLGRDA